jgi:hypothetical protein
VAICLLVALTGCQQASTQAGAETSLPPATSTTDAVEAKANTTAAAYVQASLARVRAQPDAEAQTLAQVVTNTPVKLLAEREEWCELEVAGKDILPPQDQKTANPGPDIHGFIACRLLATEPLTLAMVAAQVDSGTLDARELLNWQSRAFWIAPSLTRWAAVGTALEKLYIDESTHYKELEARRPLRFKVQEFELMKQRLAAGITVTPESYQEMWWQVLHHTQLGQQAERLKVLLPFMTEARQRVKFPEIKPSHFKNGIPVIVPALEYITPIHHFWDKISLIDALSAYNGTSFQVETIAPAFFAAPESADEDEDSDNEDAIIGLWDVSGLRVTFNGDALLYGITASGEATAKDIKTIMIRMRYDQTCKENNSCDKYYRNSQRLHSMGNQASVAGYATPVSHIVRWAGKPMPGGAAARAQIRSRNLPDTDENKAVTMHEIDLNRDGVTDLLILQGHAEQYSGVGLWESVFANINGQWLQIRVRRRLPDIEEAMGIN